jgi:hypothetical protein
MCVLMRKLVRLKKGTSVGGPNINRGILAAIVESAPRTSHASGGRFRRQERISPPFYLIICGLNAEKRVESSPYQRARSTVLESFYQL